MDNYHLLINGNQTPGASTMEVINPATEEVVAVCARADEKQLNEAVQAAKSAFPAWAALNITERRDMLMQIAGALQSRCEELGAILTSEQGKPLAQAMEEVGGAAYFIQMLASLDLPDRVVSEDENGKFVEHHKPLGVVAAITPWNYPLILMAIKMTSALLTGNTVVAKPASTTPLVSLRFAEICNDILPAGVVNMITDRNELGGLLTDHPDVAKVTFTGSTATGKKVMQNASNSLKRVTLELGGNDAAIVLDDVDPKEVAGKLFDAAMMNSGQVCLAAKRAYVHDSCYDEICEELARLADEAVVGNGAEDGVQFGPLQNVDQYNRVRDLLESAREDGNVIAGGEVSDDPGYFIRPTIVRDIADDARLVREEQFGPVLPVLRYDSIDDVIARVNDSPYGLGGTVWSSDPERATEVARKMDTGLVWINSHMVMNPNVSTGGAKQSGMGREQGIEGLEEFTQRHLIFVAK